MTVDEQLMSDMKTAMKAHDATALEVIRFLRAQIKNAQIDGGGSDDASVQKVIASQVKKSKDAIAEFKAAGRDDLASAEQQKVALMEKYLPQQLTDEQLEAVVKEVLSSASGANVGQIIGQVMKRVAGQADGARVKQVVEKLNQ